MNADLTIILTAGLVATACGLLGPYLILRRVALMGDAVSHAVLPGIIVVFILFHSRAPTLVIIGAAFFATVCVLGIEALRNTGLMKADAAIGLVFPMLFSVGVLGIHHYAEDIHLDLDATIYGEITFAPFRLLHVGSLLIPKSIIVTGMIALANTLLVILLWKELKVTSFDPSFARTTQFSPLFISRLLLIAVAVTAVTAFESVGAILVVTLLIVPAATGYILSKGLLPMIAITLTVGWIAAIGGYLSALQLDASIAGMMGVVMAGLFGCAIFLKYLVRR